MPTYYHVNVSPEGEPAGANERPDPRDRAAELRQRHVAAQAQRELRIIAAANAGAPIDPAKGDVRADD